MPFKRSFHIYLYCRRAHICLCRCIYTAAAHIYVYAAAFILLHLYCCFTRICLYCRRAGESYSCGAVWLRTGLSGPRVLAAWAKLRRKLFYGVRAAALLRPRGLSSEFLFSASFSGAREFWLCLTGPGIAAIYLFGRAPSLRPRGLSSEFLFSASSSGGAGALGLVLNTKSRCA